MTKLNEKRDFDHPCRQTCSGWQQGYDKGKAEVMPMMREMAETIRYIMNENDKVKGWDKLHDTWYAYQKLVEND